MLLINIMLTILDEIQVNTLYIFLGADVRPVSISKLGRPFIYWPLCGTPGSPTCPDYVRAWSCCFLVIQQRALLLRANCSGVSLEFSLRATPACPPHFLAHTYLITPADDKPQTTLLLASSYPVLSNVSDPHVSLLSKILGFFLFTSPHSLAGQKLFGREAARRFRGQYLLALSVSIPGAGAVMKCLSRQVIRTALGKLSLMDAAAKS